MSNITEVVRRDLIKALQQDKLTLPTLPEVALKVREVVQDPDADINSITKVLSNDAALSARIIKVANSPLLRGANPIQDIKMAVSRLGLNYTANLATGLAMEQMFQATSDIVDTRMRDVWSKSTEIAGMCHVLCRAYTRLQPDQATLAGLIHKIGVLPILKFAEEVHTELLDNAATLDLVINDLQGDVGTLILKTWDFPPDLIIVPREHINFQRKVASADYADLVMIANLQGLIGSKHPFAQLDWANIPAFKRVGVPPDQNLMEDEDLSEQMAAAMAMLG